ncbi:hypothetical protein ABFX02_14G254600 [Erythranthe guttata]|nr:PREDICTED: uncharacterized protein LOC105959186 [Erythranthe guttata]|eukprot:XP_012838685.1 PREDICTED: uncharacterized protein LOC105959186 [Erythranthe guttata]
MHTDLKPLISSMGLPSIKVASEAKILSGKDNLHATTKCNFFFEKLHNKEEADQKSAFSAPVLKIKLPSSATVDEHGEEEEEEEDGGCRTPKAVDHEKNIPPKCPPPPRKPKSTLLSLKRKLGQRVLLDLSSEIESLFPPNLLRDFVSGSKIKKLRQETS